VSGSTLLDLTNTAGAGTFGGGVEATEAVNGIAVRGQDNSSSDGGNGTGVDGISAANIGVYGVLTAGNDGATKGASALSAVDAFDESPSGPILTDSGRARSTTLRSTASATTSRPSSTAAEAEPAPVPAVPASTGRATATLVNESDRVARLKAAFALLASAPAVQQASR
jgi:hypothetical protein